MRSGPKAQNPHLDQRRSWSTKPQRWDGSLERRESSASRFMADRQAKRGTRISCHSSAVKEATLSQDCIFCKIGRGEIPQRSYIKMTSLWRFETSTRRLPCTHW